jgi:4a-hydroxytetrahydrobiopterin dehydratase
VKKLTMAQVQEVLRSTPGWHLRGKAICAVFKFADFVAAMSFVKRVAKLAERLGHHPDILIQWNTVKLTCTTHDAGGLTARDMELAAACQKLAGRG